MESCMTGRGYTPRRIYPHRRLRRYSRQGRLRRFGQSRLGRVIAFQALVCSILLFVAVLARVLNIGVAGYITEKVRYVLQHDMELKSIYTYAQTLASDIRSSINRDGDRTGNNGSIDGDTENDKRGNGGDIRDNPAIASTDGSLADSSDNTATLSAEMALPDTMDATSGIYDEMTQSGNNWTQSGGDSDLTGDIDHDGETVPDGHEGFDGKETADSTDAPQQNESETRVLAASSEIDDSVENTHDPPDNSDDSAKDTSPGQKNVVSDADKYGDFGKKRGDFNMAVPVEGKVATPFGETEGAAGMLKMHNGIDISVGKMSWIKAALDGRVEDAGSSPGYGKFIKIRHSDRLVTVYANCSDIFAGIGEYVGKGDVIAVAGGERTAGGSHVHFEVWQDGVPADPLDYISIDYR